jgi:AbrB family looped-hinge helix DNA binding protein
MAETSRVGKRGAVVIPAALRRRYGIEEGSLVLAEERPDGIELPEKDVPILCAVIAADATHLLTGDVTHFGRCFGRTVSGVLILPPGDFLRESYEPTFPP